MIPLATPNLSGKETEYVDQAIASGWVGPSGPFVERFETMVAAAAGRKWAIATITGTAALHVSALFLGIAGRPVEVMNHSFPALRNVLVQLGCRILEIPGGANHDILCHDLTFMGKYLTLADRAPSIGEALPPGTLDCFSFAANKIVTCGHGGAIAGDDAEAEAWLRGEIRQGYGRIGRFNYRMANINAAIGCAQMERLAELKEAKRRIWNRYAKAGLPMIERGASRWMATANIQLWQQSHEFEYRAEPSGGVSLPCSTHLTEADQDKVIAGCVAFL